MLQHVQEVCLWIKFQQGDQEAFTRLYQLCYNKLYSYGLSIGLSDAQSRDCIQDLFLKLYTKKIKLNDDSSFNAYLYRSVRNHGINLMQRLKKHVAIDVDFNFSYTIDESLLEKENQQDLKHKVGQLMECLSARQKEIIYLRFLEELSYDQIAFVLGINQQSARNLLFRAIEKMRSISPEGYFLFIALVQDQIIQTQ